MKPWIVRSIIVAAISCTQNSLAQDSIDALLCRYLALRNQFTAIGLASKTLQELENRLAQTKRYFADTNAHESGLLELVCSVRGIQFFLWTHSHHALPSARFTTMLGLGSKGDIFVADDAADLVNKVLQRQVEAELDTIDCEEFVRIYEAFEFRGAPVRILGPSDPDFNESTDSFRNRVQFIRSDCTMSLGRLVAYKWEEVPRPVEEKWYFKYSFERRQFRVDKTLFLRYPLPRKHGG